MTRSCCLRYLCLLVAVGVECKCFVAHKPAVEEERARSVELEVPECLISVVESLQ